MIKQAIILAAGKGSRLSKYTKNVPKALLPIKYGKTILERMLDQLLDIEIKDIIIVLGYKENNSRTYINQLSKALGSLNIRVTNNVDYEITGTLKSLLIGLNQISNVDEDVLIIEGDVVCEDNILQNLAKCTKSILAVDSTSKLGDEEMKYSITEFDIILNISKDLPVEDAQGEYTGMLRLSSRDIQTFIDHGDAIYKNDMLAFYESVIDKGFVKFNFMDVAPNKWTEVDFPLEYKKARQIFSGEEKLSIDYTLFEETNHSPSLFSLIKDPDIKIKDFCFLANPYLLSEELLNKIFIELKQLIGSYPPTQKQLAIKLSQYHLSKIDPDNIIVGNGASELINIINYWSIGAIVPIPTFSEYTDSANQLLTYPLDQENNFDFDMDHFISFCKDQSSDNYPNIVLINPNNPVGKIIPRDNIIKAMIELDNFNIIVDESFLEFFHPNESVLDLINEFQNLVVIKSFGKTIGIPGVRIGAIYSNADYIKRIRRKVPEWNVNSIAAYFLDLMATKKFKNKLQNSLKKIAEDTMELFHSLKKIKNIKVFQPTGNYVLIKLLGEMNSTYLRNQLLSDNIFVRDCSNKKGLGNKFVRIASRTVKENYDIAKHIEMMLVDYEIAGDVD